MVLLLETGDLIHGVTDRVWRLDVVLLLETGDLICGATDRVWRL